MYISTFWLFFFNFVIKLQSSCSKICHYVHCNWILHCTCQWICHYLDCTCQWLGLYLDCTWTGHYINCIELVFTYTVLKLVFLLNLLGLGVAINLDTQVVPILLPVHLAVSDIEEIFDTQFLATGHLDESDSSWYVLLLRHPVCYDVVRGRPGKVPVNRN